MDQVLEDMKQLNDNDLPSLIECDHRLHKIIISKSNLSRLIKAWTELNYGSMIASINSGSYRATLADRQYIIHRNLVEVLRSGDTNAICKAIYQHYMLPLKKVISENGLSPDDFFFSSELEN
jgi:DNA-binding GntR family transcriptional regulator